MAEPHNELAFRERLKAELRIRGTSLSQLGREINVSPAAMTLVVKGAFRSERIERAIAEALDTTPDALWQRDGKETDMT